ncbi:protein phosphatase CheZ [Phaeovibrio sulfidiphilus]|uniref:Protein phosphatase CheZ n=2 Tax=Phaeovibrio sulfidiphilus TaxID=1220600 RepID=A0A8J6YLZ9_9PROT|nr:protein phosphatase CheZ [Phaeovibrio sulfidiphilus]MBE1237063.1 protein phosphatase CheZ [Phaeovibrio sulfidiphilus]
MTGSLSAPTPDGTDRAPGGAVPRTDPMSEDEADALAAWEALEPSAVASLSPQPSQVDPSMGPEALPTGVGDDDAQLLRREVASMIRSLAAAKREIAEIKHPVGGDDRMKRATLELDAIVGATEEATEQILGATESINANVDTIRAFASGSAEVLASVEVIEHDVTRIMEACTFQDITGQRITRVIRTFEFIEDRLRTIIETLGVDSFTEIPVSSADVVIHSGDELVNGPQLGGSALSQDDIDALFG